MIGLALISCLFLNMFHLQKKAPERFYNDDALFYSIIAYNFIDTGLFTFDRESKTNGFHWGGMIPALFVCSFIKKIYPNQLSYNDYFVFQTFIDGLILAIIVFIFWMTVFKKHLVNINSWGKYILSVGFVLFISLSLFPAIGLETIYLPLLFGLLTVRIESRSISHFLIGLISFLIILVRIDYLVIIFVYMIFLKIIDRISSKDLLFSLSGIGFGLSTIFLLNILSANSIFSTSAILKSQEFTLTNVGELVGSNKIVLFLLLYLLLLIVSISISKNNLVDRLCIDLSLLTVLIYIQISLQRTLFGGNLGSWYDVTHFSLGITVVFLLMTKFVKGNKSFFIIKYALIGISTAMAIILIPTGTTIDRYLLKMPENISELKNYCAKIEAIVGKNERLAIDDNPGVFRLYTNRNVIPLDGLVNSNEYIKKYLLVAKVDEYLKKKRIEYLVISRNRVNCGNEICTGVVGFLFSKKPVLSTIMFNKEQVLLEDKVGETIYMLIKLT